MKKLLIGLVLGLSATAANAQSVLQAEVVFDTVYEASGAFAPNLNATAPARSTATRPSRRPASRAPSR
jgi:hypothetical protein